MPSRSGNTDFILFLKEELERRRAKNHRYSLRAFAKSLETSHTSLSLILRNKRPLTRETVKLLSQNLKLSAEAVETFLNNITYDYESFHRSRQKIKRMRQLSLESFAHMSAWYHDAILELARISGFKMEAQAIAKRLGMDLVTTNGAMKNLIKLGFLKSHSDTLWTQNIGDSTTTTDFNFSNEALLKYQEQILQKSLTSLSLPRTKRDHSSMTMAINKSDLPVAKVMIQKFCRELMSYMQRESVEFEDVYQLSVSLFPVTESESSPQ